MDKIVSPGKGPNGRIFCKIQIKNGNLSITGVEGPMKNGDAPGSCGQIVMHPWEITEYSEGWSPESVDAFRACWDSWHLNDMRAACEHQRSRGETWATHPSVVCPQCGYKLGHAWLKEELPAEVITYLESLPATSIVPAWV